MHDQRVTVSFGQWLKQRRRTLDLTQEELAMQIGCSDIAIRKIEAGERRPSRQMAELLADLFKVPADEREGFIGFARGVKISDDQTQQIFPKIASDATSEQRPASNLPAQLTRLIGREEVAAEIGSRLLQDEVRLLTLTGPPGIGKTRLAMQVASDLIGQFEDGVSFVPLASIRDPGLVAQAIAQALGVRESGKASVTVSLAQHLRGKQMLLVLDNFEQVVEASPVMVALLEASPELKMLVTSREALSVSGEQQFQVPPLTTPDPAHLPPMETLPTYPAMALFVERARAVKPNFALTEQNAQSVAAICARLQGMPLPIELAAARVSLLSPQEIELRLDNSLSLLESAARYLPPRQRTLRGAIDWSYQLLSEGEQQLFARLGVFMGGFALSSAEAVCNGRGDLPFDMVDAIGSLLDKNLLKREDVLGESRYTMLELIHEYALEQLERREEVDSIRRLHAEYFLAFVEAAEVGLSGPEQPRWLARLEAEHANIRASLRWAREKGGGTGAEARASLDIGLRIGGAVRHFWLLRSYYSQGREELQGLLSLSPPQATLSCYSKGTKAKALGAAGRLAYRQGDYSEACSLIEESLTLRREVGDKSGIAWSLTHLAMAQLQQMVDSGQGDHSTARSLQEEGLTLHRELGDIWNIALSLEQLGILAYLQGDYSRATSLLEESLALHKEQGQVSSIGKLLYQLGTVAYLQGDYSRATSLLEGSLTRQSEIRYKVGIALSLAGLGEVSAATELPRRGAMLMGASEALHEAIGGVMEPCDRIAYDRALTFARSQLGDEEFEKARQEGRAMTMEQAITYALKDQAQD